MLINKLLINKTVANFLPQFLFFKGPAIASIFPIIDGNHSIYSEYKNFDNDGVIEWETKNPQMLTKYSLKWNSIK
jgi:hypothetical protein